MHALHTSGLHCKEFLLIHSWLMLLRSDKPNIAILVQVVYKFCTTAVLGGGLAYSCTYLYILVLVHIYTCTYLYKSCTYFAQNLHCGKSCTRRKTGKNIFGLPCSFARRNQQCFLRMICLMTVVVFFGGEGMEWMEWDGVEPVERLFDQINFNSENTLFESIKMELKKTPSKY